MEQDNVQKYLSAWLTSYGNDPIELLKKLGGYYECPKDLRQTRLGPLVGYAGTYEEGKQYVGEIYANFAKAEEYPEVLHHFANTLTVRPRYALNHLGLGVDKITLSCGLPLGGMAFAQMCAFVTKKRYAFMEKKVTALATASSREQSKMIFNRHKPRPGDKVALVEDVLNNFSTTDKAIKAVEDCGAEVVIILGILNRSLTVEEIYSCGGKEYPVCALARKPIAEYRQDEPFVRYDVDAGRVVWKPKDDVEWSKLMSAMNNPLK